MKGDGRGWHPATVLKGSLSGPCLATYTETGAAVIMPSDFLDQMARTRALQMAQLDCTNGIIEKDAIITQARQYESYLTGRPVTVSERLEPVTPEPPA
jgi:hypothetical protein